MLTYFVKPLLLSIKAQALRYYVGVSDPCVIRNVLVSQEI